MDYRYEWDAWAGGLPCLSCKRIDRNPRTLQTTTTSYAADGVSTADKLSSCLQQYVGYGHYQYTRIMDGGTPGQECTSGTLVKTTEASWDTPVPANWLLHTYSKIKTTGASSAIVGSLSKYAFDATTGFLKAKCDYKKHTANNETQTCDSGGGVLDDKTPEYSVKTVYIDPGSVANTTDGWPSYEEFYDKETASITDPSYRLHHYYQHGALSQSLYQQKISGTWRDNVTGWYAFKQDINPTTQRPDRTYDSTGALAASTSYGYDVMGRVTAITPQGVPGITVQYLPDADGFLRWIVVSRDGKEQGRTVLDNFGRTAEERKTLPGGVITKRIHQFDVLGREIFVSSWVSEGTIPWAGNTTVYDALGRAKTATLTGSDPVGYSYVGSRSRTIERRFMSEAGTSAISRTVQTYDALGRLTDSVIHDATDARVGPLTHTEYDLNGKPISVTVTGSGGPQLRTFEFDLLGRMFHEDHPEGKKIWYGENGIVSPAGGYDALGNLIHKKVLAGANAYYFTYEYDYAGRPTAEKVSATDYPGSSCSADAGCYVTREMKYDVTITPTGLDNAPSWPSVTTGSAKGKLVSTKTVNLFDSHRTLPLGSGCPLYRISYTDLYVYGGPRGQLSERRLYSENFKYTSSSSADYFYFKWGYQADSLGRTDQITYPEAYLTSGNTSLDLTAGVDRTLAIGYDTTALNSLARLGLTGTADVIQAATYAEGGLPRETVYGNGTSGMFYDYDSLNRLQDLYGYNTEGYLLKQLSMQYDGSGNLYYFHNADVISPVNPIIRPCKLCGGIKPCRILYRNYNAGYDELNRLRKYKRTEARTGVNCWPQFVDERAWTYDDYGNIIERCTNYGDGPDCPPLPIPIAANNQLSGMVYDGRGNVKEPDDRHTYLYSPATNQMNDYMEEGDSGVLEAKHLFAQDAGGRRVWDSKRWIVPGAPGCNNSICYCYNMDTNQAVWAQDTIFIRDEGGRILAEFDREMDISNHYQYSWRRNNYHLFGKMVAADVNTNANGNPPAPERRYYFHDHLGSLRAVTDAQDTYLNTMEYWPFGEEMYSQTNNEDSYRYTGHERDYDLDLDYMHARHYDYARGRFMSPDPVNTGVGNLYTYVGNNPLNYTDPWGLAARGMTSSPTGMPQIGHPATEKECEDAGCAWDEKAESCSCEGNPTGEIILIDVPANAPSKDPDFWRFLMAGSPQINNRLLRPNPQIMPGRGVTNPNLRVTSPYIPDPFRTIPTQTPILPQENIGFPTPISPSNSRLTSGNRALFDAARVAGLYIGEGLTNAFLFLVGTGEMVVMGPIVVTPQMQQMWQQPKQPYCPNCI
jgi:RHS repeat-associated protein